MFKFLTRRHFLVNLLASIVLVVAILFLFLWSLGFITRHGEYEKVPGMEGKTVAQAIEILESRGFSVEVQDSVWREDQAPLTVIRQSPEADQLVKAHRRIYLTLNRSQPPLVDVPNMVGLSFRNAELYLKQLGLKLGDTTRRPDIAKDAILEQLYNGTPLMPGAKIFQGSSISFVLGSGIGEDEFDVPDLRGLSFRQAKSLLAEMGLNVAGVLADADVRDTAAAFIYKQNPEITTKLPDDAIQKNKIRPGQSIDLWLSNKMKIFSSDSSAEKSGY